MELKKYAQDALFEFPLSDFGGTNFEAGVTIAAGDAKLFTDSQILSNLTAEAVAFSSGSEEPSPGDTLEGASSTETCVFMFAVVTSGTWGGGDAAGVLFVKTVSGAFSGENLDIDGGTANVLTIAGDFTAGLFGAIGSGLYAVALTAAEMTCDQGIVRIVDQTATREWEDQAVRFETFGNPTDLTDLATAAAEASGQEVILEIGCQAGSQTTGVINILESGSPATTNALRNCIAKIISGTGADDVPRRVLLYTIAASNRLCSVEPPLLVACDDTSVIQFRGGVDVRASHVMGTAGMITAASIATDAIQATKIQDNAITANKIASNAITAAKFASNAITADKIASDAIAATKIADGALTAAKFGNATAMTNLFAYFAAGITAGTLAGGTPSTTEFDTDLTIDDDDFINAALLFTSGANAGEARKISNSTGVGGHITVSEAFPETPAGSETFVILGRLTGA